MRVKVHDLIGPYAMTFEEGYKIHEAIEPALSAVELVELDFAGVRLVSAPFLSAVVAEFIPIGQPDSLDTLLSVVNLSEVDQRLFRSLVDRIRRVKTSQESLDAYEQRMAKMYEEE